MAIFFRVVTCSFLLSATLISISQNDSAIHRRGIEAFQKIGSDRYY